jgi:predicted nucleic acid-binding protein
MPALIDTCLWIDFTRKRSPRALKLLIATVAIHHDAELITFDKDFDAISKAVGLRVNLLQKPVR